MASLVGAEADLLLMWWPTQKLLNRDVRRRHGVDDGLRRGVDGGLHDGLGARLRHQQRRR